jgi:hypothetical protein
VLEGRPTGYRTGGEGRDEDPRLLIDR